MFKYLQTIMLIVILYVTSYGDTYNYNQSFESSNPFQFWTSNGTYTINYFGPSSDRSVDGSKSLKMDITVTGNGDKECFYYWKLPVNINLQGTLDFTSYLWMDSETAKYVQLGYNYDFPPTSLTRTPGIPSVTQYNTWYKQTVRLSDDVIYHADYFAHNKMYAATYDDFGRELNFIQLIIRAKGTKRLVFYIDKVQLTGNVLTQSTYNQNCTNWWNSYQSKLKSLVQQAHSEYNNLPSIPSTQNKTLTPAAQSYLNDLNNYKKYMSNLFGVIDNNEYFEPVNMDSLKTLFGLYPTKVNLLQAELSDPTSKMNVYSFSATEFNKLNGTNFPKNMDENPKLSARVCKGEYEPFSLLLQAKAQVNNIKVNWGSLSGSSGTLPSSVLDVFIAKVWYQNGESLVGTDGKCLTQELLIKNDALIKIDESTKSNYIQVTRNDGTKYYQIISNTNSNIPNYVKINDSDVLLPFSMSANHNKQLWITLHVPDGTQSGKYSGTITISADAIGTISVVPITIEVLPFNLDASRLTYGLYYHGYVNDWSWQDDPYSSFGKNSKQVLIELTDMKEHGVLYPTVNQSLSNLGLDLALRNQIGLPKDKLFAQTLSTGNPSGTSALNELKSSVNSWKSKIAQYGYSNLYAYGLDEATGDRLLSERPAWQAVHEAGAKVFASGYYDHYDKVGDLLDLGVIQPDPRKEQADLYHSKGHLIFNYSNPMVGEENPEVYRRNFGIYLWQSGYDGEMDYAYQRGFRCIWNDFDIEDHQPHPYRDHCFTYPVSDGIISTIQWEGFREGVDDVRYLSTLLNKMAALKAKGADVSYYQQFVNSINPLQNLDQVRSEIIDKILQIDGSAPQTSSFRLSSVTLVNPTTLVLKVSSQIYSGIYTTSNYVISNGITVSKAALTDKDEITLTTSSHILNQTYTISLKNLKDVDKNIISGNSLQYKCTTGDPGKISFAITNAAVISPNTLKLTFSNDIYSGVYSTGNYSITNGVNVTKAELTGKNEITLTTSNHTLDKSYTISIINLKDGTGEIISSPGNSFKYVYTNKIIVKAEQGILGNGAAFKTKAGSFGAKVAYCTSTNSTITLTLNIPQTNSYYIWGRFFYEGVKYDPNSFFVNVDDNTKLAFGNNNDFFNQWHWDGDGTIQEGNSAKLALGTLSAGQHTIVISGREAVASVMVDMILLSTDPNFVPNDNIVSALNKVANTEVQEIPDTYSLMQNYPNPFNPSTRIKFALPQSAHVILKVYDILGKEVASLIDDKMDAGYHDVEFNASDLASGMYIYRLTADHFVNTKKMLLIK